MDSRGEFTGARSHLSLEKLLLGLLAHEQDVNRFDFNNALAVSKS